MTKGRLDDPTVTGRSPAFREFADSKYPSAAACKGQHS
jgi:hypothetical protein